ncbi:MAG: response regulator transcription factor [Halanaerobium sp.]|nr:response regulator transcription factor [Halanaerobium sp.]
MTKILVMEDDRNIRELLKFNLEEAGFEVFLAQDGQEGLKMVGPEIDLVVLDLMMPDVDGLTVCRELRQDKDYRKLPIIMLTAKGAEVDRVLGLELGADDYLTKPFSPRELIARIKAILRRVQQSLPEIGETPIRIGDLVINPARYEVRKGGEPLELTPKEFELLKYLMINKGKVMTRQLLLEKIWGYEYAGDTRTIDVHIRRLRSKVGDEYISTVRGVGYKLVPVE